MRIGIDLGGTKIEALAIDNAGSTLMRHRVPTPTDRYENVITAIADLVAHVEQTLGEKGSVGVGIPGTISPASGLVKNANATMLIGHPLDRDLSEKLSRPVRIANDANCMALSEAVDGAAALSAGAPALDRARVVFGVIIGTGTGGGIVVDNKILVGPDGICGEWGHNPLAWPKPEELPPPPCWCGRTGCNELYLSGPAVARDYAAHTGTTLTAVEIAARAEVDPEAEGALARFEDRLARGLAAIINVLNPDVIVLGGGLSNLDRLYQSVPSRWTDYAFSDAISTTLVKAQHGDSSGVRGAAWLWPKP
jgi:fructokinase